jgi:hypothetical protein
MENVYECYSKLLHDKTYYFVKRYLRFSEYAHVPDVMEGYGMHTDFTRACSIAGINDLKIMKQIFDDMQEAQFKAAAPVAKVIELKKAGFESKKQAG